VENTGEAGVKVTEISLCTTDGLLYMVNDNSHAKVG
jgi:hypothetical protein